MNSIIILGSSRGDGNTAKVCQQFAEKKPCPIIDLNTINFSYYDYEHRNQGDGYLDLMYQLIPNYDTFIFATPVYWYSMSGIMKVFFDRLTDLLKIEKDLGRQLRGKNMAVISCSNGGNLEDNFWLPFSESADYLGMHYLGNIHTFENIDASESLATFVAEISANYQKKNIDSVAKF